MVRAWRTGRTMAQYPTIWLIEQSRSPIPETLKMDSTNRWHDLTTAPLNEQIIVQHIGITGVETHWSIWEWRDGHWWVQAATVPTHNNPGEPHKWMSPDEALKEIAERDKAGQLTRLFPRPTQATAFDRRA